MPRSFRFGVSLRHAESRAEWQEKARRAEALGYSIVLVPDHLAEIFPPLLPLLSVAEATSLRVGTFVLNNDFRHPAFVAREAATLDVLTDGRLELGLGAGHMESEYREVGLPFDDAMIRVERLAESTAIVKALLEGEEVTYAGSHYRLSGHRVHPLPIQKPRPPLLIGGNGRRLLTLAARDADIVGFTGFTLRRDGTFDLSAFTNAGTAERVRLVREAAGERFHELELNAIVQQVVATDSPRSAAEKIAREYELDADEILTSPYMLLGSVDAMADALRERRERHGISYWVVFEPAMEAFAPVIALLAGS